MFAIFANTIQISLYSMANGRTEGSRFVVSFLLKTEPWQEDRINQMMRMLTVLYNEKQKILLKRYIHLYHSSEFKEAKQNKSAFKKFMSGQGFSEFDFGRLFNKNTKSGSISKEQLDAHGLNSRIIQELSLRALERNTTVIYLLHSI